jgi:hypothetical protein
MTASIPKVARFRFSHGFFFDKSRLLSYCVDL